MALRGAAARRSPDGPLAGVLRDLDRRQRKPGRRPRRQRRQESTQGPPGPAGPAGPPGPAGLVTAGVARSDAEGRAVWLLPTPLRTPPVVGALPATEAPVWCVLERVAAAEVVVRVWQVGTSGVPEPAGDVAVHLTVTPREQ